MVDKRVGKTTTHKEAVDPSSKSSLRLARGFDVGDRVLEELAKQVWYWRSHLDIFIEEYIGAKDAPDIPDAENPNRIDLKPFQHEIVRACGNARDVKDIESRSLGKTWKAALTLSSLAILYPDSPILVLSKTVAQAKEVVRFIEQMSASNNNIKREIIFPISIAKDSAQVNWKNGSVIQARAMNRDGANVRGWHGKVVYLDESLFIASDVIQAAILPMLQFKRRVYWQRQEYGFEDYPSKLIETSSATLKSIDLYARWRDAARDVGKGVEDKYVCAVPFWAGLDYGIFDEARVSENRRQMPESVYDMEYGARFCGNVNGSYFPYDEVMPCRTLEKVELHQPKNCTSDYVLALDVATSERDGADNAALMVTKLIPRRDAVYFVHVVYIVTYHGRDQRFLAEEVRRVCLRFPNISKVIVDVNAIGEGVVSLLGLPFIDDNDKEHPPFLPDSARDSDKGLPIIREFLGSNRENNRGATTLKRYIQNKYLLLPIPSADVMRDTKFEPGENSSGRDARVELAAVYANADGLQVELGNIKPVVISTGVKYDTVQQRQHKDRYSVLMMIMHYVAELEERNRENMRAGDGDGELAFSFRW